MLYEKSPVAVKARPVYPKSRSNFTPRESGHSLLRATLRLLNIFLTATNQA